MGATGLFEQAHQVILTHTQVWEALVYDKQALIPNTTIFTSLHYDTPFTSGSLWVYIFTLPLDKVVRILPQSQGRLDPPQIRKGENKKSDQSKHEGRDLPV